MLSVEKMIRSLRALWSVKKEAAEAIPTLNFFNGLTNYTLRIQIPESGIQQLDVDIQTDCLTVSQYNFYRKIYFYEPVDCKQVKRWYHDGVYSIEIPKIEISPEERLNRLTLVMGV